MVAGYWGQVPMPDSPSPLVDGCRTWGKGAGCWHKASETGWLTLACLDATNFVYLV